MDILQLVNLAIIKKASDIHISLGLPPILRINGDLIKLEENPLKLEDIKVLVHKILDDELLKVLEERGEVDTSFSDLKVGRCRVNVYKQNGSYGIALRIIPIKIPTIEMLGLPSIVKDLWKLQRGLVLITGPTGSGKSTTVASIINEINENRKCHIITLEDPIEYIHTHKKSIVSQREIGSDSQSFKNGLRAALRQDPDVVLVGEMRDLETISIAIRAAETGHLVISTLHTMGAAKTIDRIIDVFPPHQQEQIRVQLSSVIQAIISQQLIPKVDGSGRVAAFEVMTGTTAIRNQIREEKTHQIDTSIQMGSKYEMQTMDTSILDLYKNGVITKEIAILQSINQENIIKYII